MLKPCKRQDLERIWQAPERKRKRQLDVASHAKALSELYHDDATVQAQDPTVGIADIELLQWHELADELHAMASNKSSDHIGLIAEILKIAPVDATDILLVLLNGILLHGELPDNWRTAQFIMIAKHIKAKTVDEFRPIALLDICYKVYARLLNSREQIFKQEPAILTSWIS